MAVVSRTYRDPVDPDYSYVTERIQSGTKGPKTGTKCPTPVDSQAALMRVHFHNRLLCEVRGLPGR
jgi:hypothetical protein